MNTDTPETSEAWNAVSRMPNGMYDSSVPMERYASAMLDHSKKLERERDEAREQLAGIEDKMRLELGGHPNSKLWGDAGLIAATMRCVDALGLVTDQRDEAREQRDALAQKFTRLDKPKYSGDPMLDSVLTDTNPDFRSWVDTLPPTYWARYDLSAARIGWEAASKFILPNA